MDDSGLIATIFAEDGAVQGSCDLRSLPGSVELRRAFAVALNRKSGPGGTWRSYEGCRHGYRAIAHLLRWSSELEDPPQTAAGITPAMARRWRMAMPDTSTNQTRQAMMWALMAELPGLAPETFQASAYRVRRAGRTPRVQASFSWAELEAIRSRAAAVFNTALLRIRTNRDHLGRWHAGEFAEDGVDWLLGEALDRLALTGDVPRPDTNGRHVQGRYLPALGGEGEETWGRLYLTRNEAAAASVLLVASQSWNRSVLQDMTVPEHDPTVADQADIHTVQVHKPRRPVRFRYTTNNLLDAGAGTPGRLLGQVIEATEPARQTPALLGHPTGRLLVWRRGQPVAGPTGRFGVGPPRNSEPIAAHRR